METLQVGLGERSYPIKIGCGVINQIPRELKTHYQATKYCIVADDNVASLYGHALVDAIRLAGLDCELMIFHHGEESKTLETIADLASQAAQHGLDRKSIFIALGGGVTGDITGFLAACYLRGVPFIQIPTSLLAQVDSSVGGKTGVDIPEGKNLVGAFYQPQAVFIDTDVLQTLPSEEYLNGLAEVIKYGVIRDRNFFDYLHDNRKQILALDQQHVSSMIYHCCRIKAEVVAADEKESNLRRILNYGHTIGHAVEAASDFEIPHGFAVSIGMVAVAKISMNQALLPSDENQKQFDLLKEYGLPTEIPDNLARIKIKQYLLTDKKIVGGKITFVLPAQIGEVVFSDQVSEQEIDSVLTVE
ncbi:MAG: 3-dehydroquinate synthase [Desulfobulbaceae bacterium]|nr:MAG: 3-dehydroquinate synthase [Desulfobulbaceae bacterium]